MQIFDLFAIKIALQHQPFAKLLLNDYVTEHYQNHPWLRKEVLRLLREDWEIECLPILRLFYQAFAKSLNQRGIQASFKNDHFSAAIHWQIATAEARMEMYKLGLFGDSLAVQVLMWDAAVLLRFELKNDDQLTQQIQFMQAHLDAQLERYPAKSNLNQQALFHLESVFDAYQEAKTVIDDQLHLIWNL